MEIKNLTHDEFLSKLEELNACSESIEWLKEKGYDLKDTWNNCEKYHWLYWLANKLGCERKAIVLSACKNARLVLKFVKSGEESPLKAIEMAEKWCGGDESITLQMLRSAAAAAYAAYAADDDAAAYAAYAADDDAAAYAAAYAADDDAAAYAAYAAYAAAYAAYAAYAAAYAYAAAAAAYAAYAADDDAAAYAETKKQILENIRELITITENKNDKRTI